MAEVEMKMTRGFLFFMLGSWVGAGFVLGMLIGSML